MLERLITRGRWPYLVAVAVVTAVLAVFAARVPVEQSNESMNASDAAQRATLEAFRQRFGSDEDLVLAVSRRPLLDPAGVRLLAALTARVEAIDGVHRVHSLANAIELVAGPVGAEPRPLLPQPVEGEDYEARARAAVLRNPELERFLVSPDLGTAALVVELEARPGDDAHAPRVIGALRSLIDEHSRGEAALHLAGIGAQKLEVTRLLARDQSLLIPASVAVLALVLAAFFRRPSGVAIPLAVTGVTLVWTLGIYGACGQALNTMTSLLPPVLMVLSVTTSVHLYETWSSRAAIDGTDEARIVGVVRDLRRPCAFTSLTTAAGMASLVVSDTPAVRLFGGFTALGVLISLGLGLTLVPVALTFVRARATVPRSTLRSRLDGMLEVAARLSVARSGALLAVAAVVTVAALVGGARVRTNTDLVRFLKSDSLLFRDAMFIDEHLGGIYALELVVARRDGGSLASLDAMRRLAGLQQRLVAHDEVGSVQSVLSLLFAIERAETGRAGQRLPEDEAALLHAFDLLEVAEDDDLVRQVIDPELRHARVRARLRAIGTDVAAPLEARILADARELFGPGYTIDVAGAFHQMAQDSDRLVARQVESFSLAFVLVIAAIGAMFRSLRMMLVSVVPNLVPLVWTAGVMGVLGIELSTGTTMIASVVIGIAVDDTIHYLTRFERARRSGQPVEASIRLTTTGTGRALVISSVVLVLGFWVGALGSFKPTIYFSLLTGLTMISALACDLLVLPAVLSRFPTLANGRVEGARV